MTSNAFGRGTPPETHDHGSKGYHACCIYSTDHERRLHLTRFVSEGIRAGEKVICATYDSTIEDLLADLASAGLNPATLMDSRQLVVVTSTEAYVEGGHFSVERALQRIEDRIVEAKEEGYPGVRTTGDMMWMEGLPGTRDAFLEYEARVNRIIEAHGSSALCLYDRNHFSAANLLHCLSVHPVAWVGGDEVANPHFHLPELVGDHDPIADELDRRRRAWEERARSARTEQLLERTLETLDTAVLAVDPATRTVLDGNRAAERIFGIDRDALVGTEVRTFFPTEAHWRDFELACARTLRKGATYERDGEMRRADGTAFPARHMVTWLDTHHGTGDVIVSTTRDLTRERELEAQLRQSLKMEAVGRLAGGVAREVNDLLTLVRGHAEMALDDPTEAPEDLQGILDGVGRASTLTRRLLRLSRGRHPPPGVVALGEVVRELLPVLRRLVPARIELDVEVAPGPHLIMGDAEGLERTLTHLLLNALDAIEGSGRIRITVDRTEPPPHRPDPRPGAAGGAPRPWCRLGVEDTGTGMPPEVRERIFDPFYTTDPRGKGAGLGLSTVFGIVTQMGGRVGVESEVGRGTTFELLFPEVGEEVPGADPTPERVVDTGPPTAVREARPGGTVLVIEDDENLAGVIRKVLARAGWTVHESHSAEHTRALVAGAGAEGGVGEIDVILCDVVLPGTEGPELVEELRHQLPGAPVVFMSGYSGEELRGRIPDDAAGFLRKPFSPAELVEAVRGAGRAQSAG